MKMTVLLWRPDNVVGDANDAQHRITIQFVDELTVGRAARVGQFAAADEDEYLDRADDYVVLAVFPDHVKPLPTTWV